MQTGLLSSTLKL